MRSQYASQKQEEFSALRSILSPGLEAHSIVQTRPGWRQVGPGVITEKKDGSEHWKPKDPTLDVVGPSLGGQWDQPKEGPIWDPRKNGGIGQ
jgi:hypothetical protein